MVLSLATSLAENENFGAAAVIVNIKKETSNWQRVGPTVDIT